MPLRKGTKWLLAAGLVLLGMVAHVGYLYWQNLTVNIPAGSSVGPQVTFIFAIPYGLVAVGLALAAWLHQRKGP